MKTKFMNVIVLFVLLLSSCSSAAVQPTNTPMPATVTPSVLTSSKYGVLYEDGSVDCTGALVDTMQVFYAFVGSQKNDPGLWLQYKCMQKASYIIDLGAFENADKFKKWMTDQKQWNGSTNIYIFYRDEFFKEVYEPGLSSMTRYTETKSARNTHIVTLPDPDEGGNEGEIFYFSTCKSVTMKSIPNMNYKIYIGGGDFETEKVYFCGQENQVGYEENLFGTRMLVKRYWSAAWSETNGYDGRDAELTEITVYMDGQYKAMTFGEFIFEYYGHRNFQLHPAVLFFPEPINK